MSRFLVLIYGDDEAFADLPPAEIERMLASLRPFEEKVAAEGRLLETLRLKPASTARLIRTRNGERSVTDGPFTETKEQFGGYYLVEAADAEQVVRWTGLLPAGMDSTLEIREVIEEERRQL
jgi:hypothetical protein